MRIVHVIASLKKAAGTSVFCAEVANESVAAGHAVSILVKDWQDDCYPLDKRVEVISPSRRREDVNNILLLQRATSTVVHIHAMWDPWLTKVAMAAKKVGCKVVWSPHGMLTSWAMHNRRVKKLLGWWLYQRWILRTTDLIHVTARSEVEDVRRMGLRNPVVVAPLGVRIGHIEDVRHRDGRTLLFVSRIHRKKGLSMLFEAWARLSRGLKTGWTIHIVGPDQDGHAAELKELAEWLGIADAIKFFGPKYGVELQREYAAADLFVLPTHSENFGSVVIEALAQKLPVICTKGAPWQELEDCRCGWWIDIGVEPLVEALQRAMSLTDEERRQMGERGRQLVEGKYTWEAVVDKMIEGYKGVLT